VASEFSFFFLRKHFITENDVESLKEQVTTLSTSYLTTTNERRIDISQSRLDISYNFFKTVTCKRINAKT
jgi:hypothetical protein